MATRGQEPVFKWSAGVRAFCALLIRAKLHELSDSWDPKLSGIQGSLAASLDRAIAGRDLPWVRSMLGTDLLGHAVARRTITVENTRLQGPGPVKLWLNTSFLDPTQISLYIGSKELTSPEDLTAILQSVENEIPFSRTLPLLVKNGDRNHPPLSLSDSQVVTPPHFRGRVAFEKVLEWWWDELRQSLSWQDLIDPRIHGQLIASLPDLEWGSALIPMLRRMPVPSQVGISMKAVAQDLKEMLAQIGGLDVFIAYPGVGAICLFLFLRDTYRLPIRLHYCYENTFEVLDKEDTDWRPESSVTVFTFGEAIHLLEMNLKASIVSLMFLPGLSHRVIAVPKVANFRPDIASGLYFYYTHPSRATTGPDIYLERLIAAGEVSARDIEIKKTDAKELERIAEARDCDVKLLLWFPIYKFYSTLYGWDESDKDNPAKFVPPLLYVPEGFRVSGLADHLHTALCSAWRILRADSELRKKQAQKLLLDNAYVSFVDRAVFGDEKPTDWTSTMFRFHSASKICKSS